MYPSIGPQLCGGRQQFPPVTAYTWLRWPELTALVVGFAAYRDDEGILSIDPQLPDASRAAVPAAMARLPA